MEDEIYRQGIRNAETLFFSADVDSSTYADYVNNFGSANIMPAENSFSPDAPECVAKFIREVISAEQVEPMSSEEEIVNDSLPENRPKDELERMEEIHKTLLSKYRAGELERPSSKIRKLVITKSVTPRRELDNKENIHYNTEDMNAFNIIEYLKKEPFDIDEYLQMIGRAELLSREEEQALVEKAQQGDEEAMNTLLCANARFVTNLANQYKHKGASLQQLLNVAMPVLQKAVLEYDVHNEDPLLKYAVPQMREVLEQI
jgi:DNA-directed RNA polymerase sigma subunit (sigma70/sigma32)